MLPKKMTQTRVIQMFDVVSAEKNFRAAARAARNPPDPRDVIDISSDTEDEDDHSEFRDWCKQRRKGSKVLEVVDLRAQNQKKN